MSSLLIQAAHSAAQADGLAPPAAADLQGTVAAAVHARAAAAAAVAAASSPLHNHNGGGGGGGKKKGPPLRRGKWTAEEEAYANRLIQEFKAGLLPLTDGTTLRTFLSKLLNCDPMRISKKFVGSNCIGKQVFRRRNADMNRLTPEQIQQSRAELSEYVSCGSINAMLHWRKLLSHPRKSLVLCVYQQTGTPLFGTSRTNQSS